MQIHVLYVAVFLPAALGCNEVFGLTATTLDDSAIPIDAPRLLVPPDGSTTCPPPPNLDAWTFSPVSTFATEVVHPTFLAADRVAYTAAGQLYESSLAGDARPIAELELSLVDIVWPAAAPGADLVWFLRVPEMAVPVPDVGLFYAHRDVNGWIAHRADLGVTGYQLQAGSVGFFAGSARMVVGLTPTMGDRMRLVELSSLDGLSWTRLDSFPFSNGADTDFDPALSADGCLVLHVRGGGIHAAFRQSDGTFSVPQRLIGANDTSTFTSQPAIDPSGTRLWVKRGAVLVEGRP